MMRGWQWPCVVTHQDEIASTMPAPVGGVSSAAPSARVDQRDRLAQAVLGEGMPDRRASCRKVLDVGNWLGERASASVSRRQRIERGRRPSRLHAADRAMVASLSAFASPTKATPEDRHAARAQSLDRQQAVVDRAERRCARPASPAGAQRANRSANSRSRVDRHQHAARAFDHQRRRRSRAASGAPGSIVTPSISAARCGEQRRGQAIGFGQDALARHAGSAATRLAVGRRRRARPGSASSRRAPARRRAPAANTVLPMPVSVPVTIRRLMSAWPAAMQVATT